MGLNTPGYTLLVGERDISSIVRPLLLDATVEDFLGGQADRLRLRLSAAGPGLEAPAGGEALRFSLGMGAERHFMGDYVVDAVSISHPPTVMEITARAANLTSGIRAPRSQAWTGAALGQIAGDVAARNGLDLRIAPGLAAHRFTQVEQASESDLHLVTRLARDLDATAKVAEGALVLAPKGRAVTISGAPMAAVTIRPQDASGWEFRRSGRQSYGGVAAQWGDRAAGGLSTEQVGEIAPIFQMRRAHASKEEARAAAASKQAALARATGKLQLSLAAFRPDIVAGAPLTVAGMHAAVDGDWVADAVRHQLDGSGLRSALEASPRTGD